MSIEKGINQAIEQRNKLNILIYIDTSTHKHTHAHVQIMKNIKICLFFTDI